MLAAITIPITEVHANALRTNMDLAGQTGAIAKNTFVIHGGELQKHAFADGL